MELSICYITAREPFQLKKCHGKRKNGLNGDRGRSRPSQKREFQGITQFLAGIIRARVRQSLSRQTKWEKFSVYARNFRRCDKFKSLCCKSCLLLFLLSRRGTQGFRFRRSFRQIKSHLKVKTKTWSDAVGENQFRVARVRLFRLCGRHKWRQKALRSLSPQTKRVCTSACLNLTEQQKKSIRSKFYLIFTFNARHRNQHAPRQPIDVYCRPNNRRRQIIDSRLPNDQVLLFCSPAARSLHADFSLPRNR